MEIEYGPIEHAGQQWQRSSPFPAEWGTPPIDVDKRAGWATSHIMAAALRQRMRQQQGRELLAELEERPIGLDGAEALRLLERRYGDPTVVRPTLTADEAQHQLDRRTARYHRMLALVGEPW